MKYKHLNEEYPQSFNKEEFEKIKSFQGKLNYAVKHLQKIASGSARTVFKIDDQKVLKIAKNKKGLAQNSVESEAYAQNYEIAARTFDSDRNNFWVEMELAKKVTPTMFRNIVGLSLDRIETFLRHEEHKHGKGNRFFHPPMPTDYDKIKDNEYAIELLQFMLDYDMPSGDLGRYSSYGMVMRDGKPRIVLVDFGLTQQVWEDFYKVK